MQVDRDELDQELQKAKDEAEHSLYLRALYHADYIALENKHKEVEAQLATVTADRDELRSQLAELEHNPATASDLSTKAGDIASFFKTLLAKDTKLVKDVKQDKDVKLPKDTISKIEEILGGGDG